MGDRITSYFFYNIKIINFYFKLLKINTCLNLVNNSNILAYFAKAIPYAKIPSNSSLDLECT